MNQQTRFRIVYKKGQALRYTANLDLHKIWERWMRRTGLPLAYSQGFHPQPRMNQAAPLPLGMLSDAEVIDIWIDSTISLENLQQYLVDTPQPGIEITSIRIIPGNEPSIQTRVHHVDYLAQPLMGKLSATIQPEIDHLLSTNQLLRVRRQKEYDLRPLILQLAFIIVDSMQGEALSMSLLSLPGQTGRPDEVIQALGYDPSEFRFTRTAIHLTD
ncbi:MAG: DUF2344 domain-containing protein [Anaerolineae bacterium]|nr:DUF2344 domain-containing protein [Anaerolineae bacterium]